MRTLRIRSSSLHAAFGPRKVPMRGPNALRHFRRGERRCDAVVVVSAPAEVQRARVFERPGMTDEKYAALSARQMPDAEKRRRADFVVDSARGFDAAQAQVRDILKAVATMPKRRD